MKTESFLNKNKEAIILLMGVILGMPWGLVWAEHWAKNDASYRQFICRDFNQDLKVLTQEK